MLKMIINPLPHNPDILWPRGIRLLKTLWEKEKILVTSIFSLSPQCFLPCPREILWFGLPLTCKCFEFGHVQNFVSWEIVNPFSNKPMCTYMYVYCTSLLKTLWEKGKLLVTSNFSFSHSIFFFFFFRKLSTNLIKIKVIVCKLFCVWERVKFSENLVVKLRTDITESETFFCI